MSDEEKKVEAGEAAPAPVRAKPGVIALLLPALLAGGAAFGGAKLAVAKAMMSSPAAASAPAPSSPPGTTLSLDPFLVNTQDASHRMHPMKVTLAVEFDEHTKEDAAKTYVPRIRDASLSYFRTISYEDAIDTTRTDKLRVDVLAKLKESGATGAQRVLITDLVVQ